MLANVVQRTRTFSPRTECPEERSEMDVPSVLREVDAWPVQDRMLLVQELWDRLVDQGYEPELWENLRDELDRRLAADEAAPDDVVSWEEVKAEALKRAGR